jgi:RNA polymerase sigma-70 factor (ECF subfamily)
MPLDDNGFEPLSPGPAASRLVEKKEESALLDYALASLPTESRDLITLRFIEELSYAEIARTTGASEVALRGRVFRSLRMLRDALAGKGVEHAV